MKAPERWRAGEASWHTSSVRARVEWEWRPAVRRVGRPVSRDERVAPRRAKAQGGDAGICARECYGCGSRGRAASGDVHKAQIGFMQGVSSSWALVRGWNFIVGAMGKTEDGQNEGRHAGMGSGAPGGVIGETESSVGYVLRLVKREGCGFGP